MILLPAKQVYWSVEKWYAACGKCEQKIESKGHYCPWCGQFHGGFVEGVNYDKNGRVNNDRLY